MKTIGLSMIWLAIGSSLLWAMPSQITLQGTLKEKGVPVNTTKNMQFNFVDSSGASIPGTSPIIVSNVQVTNGLYAVQLPVDQTIPWAQYTPFIQVSIEGQILSPNQPISANLYAVAAIPQGMVSMFDGPCPTGWTSFAPLNGNGTTIPGTFPMGGTAYGATGGSATHTHTINAATHTQTAVVFGSGQGSGSFWSDWARADHVHTMTAESNLPPFVTMVFCRKQ